ncbi:cold shock protein 2-like [Prosopis cineraria]|uniref:cold shock protein 2-like n=1 Tax=Prosopis cineraria TaxID=364024 RepID=UPI00240F5B1E|nr:cold shock protein 2-like [Prosopis cineraria]
MNMKPFILCLFLGMLLISATATDRLSKQEADQKAGTAAKESKTTTSGWGGGGGGPGGGGWGGGGGHGGCHQCCKWGRCWCC